MEHSPAAQKILGISATIWFITAATGQLIFVYYLAMLYGWGTLTGNWQVWNTVMPKGYIDGDSLGNFAVSFHVLVAILIMTAGIVQLIPHIRQRCPHFHRWTGRFYISAAILTSIAGLYLIWIRGGTAGDFTQHLGLSGDALLIIVFAILTLYFAINRKLLEHRRWALRLFMVVNAVWFFRIGLMLWFTVHQAPVGIDTETFTGPFLSFLSFADYLIPLAFLELYLRAQESRSAIFQYLTAIVIFIATLATVVGIFAAYMALWGPRI